MSSSEKKDRTMALIDSFLEEHKDVLQSEELEIASSDYVDAYLRQESAEPETAVQIQLKSRSEALLDAFLSSPSSVKDAVTAVRRTDEQNPDTDAEQPTMKLNEQCFTQTLARIYLKQHKYDKAMEIIRSLYLNFPNKNIYFADQIRFLEKLIKINQN